MFTVFALFALVAAVSSACVDDHPNCPSWAANGLFCTNPMYASMRTTCQRSCGLCTPCEDLNVANCINWVLNRFCTNPLYSDAEKLRQCPASCGLCPP